VAIVAHDVITLAEILLVARFCIYVISLFLIRSYARVSMTVTPMSGKRERNGLYRSSQVAKILGVSSRTLYRMLADGRIQEPMRNPENRYRLWTEVDIHVIRDVMHK
jgi:excisionase family DNA binding protein